MAGATVIAAAVLREDRAEYPECSALYRGARTRACHIATRGDAWLAGTTAPCVEKSLDMARTNAYATPMRLRDTIAAVSTPPGRGGIGIVRLSGTDARKIAETILQFP